MFSRTRQAVLAAETAVRFDRNENKRNRNELIGKFSFQQRLRDEREQKRSNLDERHRHLFDIIATRLAIERNEVEENILDSTNVKLFSRLITVSMRKSNEFSRTFPSVLVDGSIFHCRWFSILDLLLSRARARNSFR